ncbi:hypothetical protein ACIDE9_00150 [Methylophilus sp. 'Pure River']|uniref:hypothetical protein n=1 Tax=Methylophilus sp. 'Pure River' TaxID=3377117 RepID=UPI00398F2C5B
MLDYANIATVISAFIATVSAVIAAFAIFKQSETQQNERYLDQANLTLKNAYEALTMDRKVSAERLDWLTCARHLERYKTIKKLITLKAHQLICEEQEEFWRHQFYLSLKSGILNQSSFYAENRDISKEKIEPKSALVIHDFAIWPEGKEDPIDLVDEQAILMRGKVLNGNIGLRHYLEEMPKYQNTFERMKQLGLIR